jgi:hypothetical protein
LKYENHPFADCFPMMSIEEIKTMANDIKENGLINAIVLFENKILDGRNRYAACQVSGVDPRYIQYAGKTPLAYVVSLNMSRRHLSESQRAIAAAKIANMKSGERTDLAHCQPSANLHSPQISLESSAKMMNVSRRAVADVKKIMRDAPEKIAEIERGEKTVHGAMVEIKESKPRENDSPNNGDCFRAKIDPAPEKEKDSETLIGLRRYWRTAKKWEKNNFFEWLKSRKDL